jgi:hypothetical protein
MSPLNTPHIGARIEAVRRSFSTSTRPSRSITSANEPSVPLHGSASVDRPNTQKLQVQQGRATRQQPVTHGVTGHEPSVGPQGRARAFSPLGAGTAVGAVGHGPNVASHGGPVSGSAATLPGGTRVNHRHGFSSHAPNASPVSASPAVGLARPRRGLAGHPPDVTRLPSDAPATADFKDEAQVSSSTDSVETPPAESENIASVDSTVQKTDTPREGDEEATSRSDESPRRRRRKKDLE